MKQYAVRFGTALVAAVLCVAGCSNPAQSETGLEGSAAVLLSLAGSGSRTLVPAGTLEYLILCTPSTGGPAVAEDYWDGSGVKTIPLSEGTWRISVEGRISIAEGPFTEVSAGSANITVRIGETVTKTIAMKPTQVFQGQGTFKHDAGNACPVFGPGVEPAELALAELVLTKADTGALLHTIDLFDGSVPAEIALPAGYYTAAVTLVKNTGERAAKTAAVHIYKQMLTALGDSPVFRFTPEDFTAYSFDDIEALTAYLSAARENGPETPYLVKLKGIDLEGGVLAGEQNFSTGRPPLPMGRDLLYKLYESFQGKYVTLDLSAYTNIPSTEATVNYGYAGLRPDRDKLVGLILSPTAASIGNNAFYQCTSLITSIDLPDSLTAIGQNAFFGAGFTELVLPESLISIGISAFNNYQSPNPTRLESVDFSACRNLTSIGYAAFGYNAGLTSVDLSPCTSLEILDGATFRDCTALTSITLPESLTTIRDNAFNGCTALTSITPA